MNNEKPPEAKKGRPREQADLQGSGAVAQGRRAKAAGERAVMVEGDSNAPISTGSGDIYQTIVQQGARPRASAEDLRRAYLAWLSARANELPLLAGDGDKPAQLSYVYTALLTQSPDLNGDTEMPQRLRGAARQETQRLSALEALDRERLLVLMGGPGSGTPAGLFARIRHGRLIPDRRQRAARDPAIAGGNVRRLQPWPRPDERLPSRSSKWPMPASCPIMTHQVRS
jgi:hypothetical protein